jgi:Uroporphyrinogen-III synthase
MRILVTRPAHDAQRTAEKLIAMGHEPVVAPVMTISPTDIPAPAQSFDNIIVTSANGAARLADLPGWQDRTIYAVGPRTADAILEYGAPHDLRIAAGDAVSIIAMVKAEQPRQISILHVTGVNHKAEPDRSLRAAGYEVFTWTAYEAAAASSLPETARQALQGKRLDAAIHYSRRSVETLVSLVTAAGMLEAFSTLRHFCLSDDIAEPLKALNIKTIAASSDPSEAALLALLPQHQA